MDTPSASQGGLLQRQEQLVAQHQRSLSRVRELVGTQQEISQQLSDGLGAMQQHGRTLDAIEVQARQSGVLAALTRAFSRRRVLLQRRSAAEGLLSQYETVSVSLRRASAFADELRLCALDLQQQVDDLHADLATSRDQSRRAAQRVIDGERELEAVEARIAAGQGDPAQLERLRDRLGFQQRTDSTTAELLRARASLCQQELDPARALRDTIVQLHEEMAHFVVKATSAVNTAGRRIQALGLAADAPLVVAELHESLAQLDAAMDATQQTIAQTQRLLTDVLPDLSAHLSQRSQVESLMLTQELGEISRERARAVADRVLQEAARAEVDALDTPPLKTL